MLRSRHVPPESVDDVSFVEGAIDYTERYRGYNQEALAALGGATALSLLDICYGSETEAVDPALVQAIAANLGDQIGSHHFMKELQNRLNKFEGIRI